MSASARQRTSHRSTPWEKFVLLPDDDRRELIDGELIETEMPTRLHEHIVARITFFFTLWIRQHGGSAYASGYRVRIDAKNGFYPDAQLYHPANRAQLNSEGCVRGAPDVALEVLSEGSIKHDRKTKLLGYSRIGVTEYWIAAQLEPTLERLVLRRGKYVVEDVLTPGDVLKPARFPGMEIPISELYSFR
jgi:Uma2 family endonuclease